MSDKKTVLSLSFGWFVFLLDVVAYLFNCFISPKWMNWTNNSDIATTIFIPMNLIRVLFGSAFEAKLFNIRCVKGMNKNTKYIAKKYSNPGSEAQPGKNASYTSDHYTEEVKKLQYYASWFEELATVHLKEGFLLYGGIEISFNHAFTEADYQGFVSDEGPLPEALDLFLSLYFSPGKSKDKKEFNFVWTSVFLDSQVYYLSVDNLSLKSRYR